MKKLETIHHRLAGSVVNCYDLEQKVRVRKTQGSHKTNIKQKNLHKTQIVIFEVNSNYVQIGLIIGLVCNKHICFV